MNGLLPVVLVSWVHMWSREEIIMNVNEIHLFFHDLHFDCQGEVVISMTSWSWYRSIDMSIGS